MLLLGPLKNDVIKHLVQSNDVGNLAYLRPLFTKEDQKYIAELRGEKPEKQPEQEPEKKRGLLFRK